MGIEHDLQVVMTCSNIELGVVMKWLRVEFLQLFLVFEVEADAIAESRRNRSVQLISKPKDIDRGVQFALLLLELDRVRGNLDCQVHSCRVHRSVKVRSQHGGSDGTRLRTGNAALQLLFFRLSGKHVRRLHVAVSTAPASDRPAALDLDLEYVAASFFRSRGRISQDVVLGLLLRDLLHTAEQIVRIHDHESTGTLCQLIQDLLVIHNIRNYRNDLAALVVRIVATVDIRIVHGDTANAIATTDGSRATAAASATTSASTACSTTLHVNQFGGLVTFGVVEGCSHKPCCPEVGNCRQI